MSQSIIISQGTTEVRDKIAEDLIKDLLSSTKDFSNHMDFKLCELIEDKKLISIDQIRDLIREINIKPRISKAKVIWIKESQALSTEAQNAMLKTLEEPPEYAHIILTVNHSDNLIPTVVSRCITKNLALSSRVDINSDQYTEAKEEFQNILNMNIGEKIDWVTENKTKIKDREEVLSLLDIWETILRDKMLEAVHSNNNVEEWKDKILLIQKIKKYINQNSNVALSIETLLLNL